MDEVASLLLGSAFVLATTRRWPVKVAAVGIPLVFVGYSLVRSLTTPETYLIPTTYRGRVLVVFNQPDGQKPDVEQGRRLYRISSGVLFTQLAAEQGFIYQQYYFPETPARMAPTQRMQGLLHGLVLAPVRYRVVAASREPHQGTRPALAPALAH